MYISYYIIIIRIISLNIEKPSAELRYCERFTQNEQLLYVSIILNINIKYLNVRYFYFLQKEKKEKAEEEYF